MNRRFRFILSSLLGLFIAAPGNAFAIDDTKVRCQTAYEHGQQLQREAKLSAARVELLVCIETCPATFATDCHRWLQEVDALAPTVRIQVQTAGGESLSDVRVTVDGVLMNDAMAPHAIPVDAGLRVLRFERSSMVPVEVKLALEPGERDRLVSVIMEDATPTAKDRAELKPSRDDRRLPSYLFATAGAGAFAMAGALAVKGHLDRADLQSSCAPACNPADADPIRTLWRVAAISGGVGLLSVGAAILLWPRRSLSDGQTARANVVSMPGGVGVRVAFP